MKQETINKQINFLDKASKALFKLTLIAFFTWLFAQIIINL